MFHWIYVLHNNKDERVICLNPAKHLYIARKKSTTEAPILRKVQISCVSFRILNNLFTLLAFRLLHHYHREYSHSSSFLKSQKPLDKVCGSDSFAIVSLFLVATRLGGRELFPLSLRSLDLSLGTEAALVGLLVAYMAEDTSDIGRSSKKLEFI